MITLRLIYVSLPAFLSGKKIPLLREAWSFRGKSLDRLLWFTKNALSDWLGSFLYFIDKTLKTNHPDAALGKYLGVDSFSSEFKSEKMLTLSPASAR